MNGSTLNIWPYIFQIDSIFSIWKLINEWKQKAASLWTRQHCLCPLRRGRHGTVAHYRRSCRQMHPSRQTKGHCPSGMRWQGPVMGAKLIKFHVVARISVTSRLCLLCPYFSPAVGFDSTIVINPSSSTRSGTTLGSAHSGTVSEGVTRNGSLEYSRWWVWPGAEIRASKARKGDTTGFGGQQVMGTELDEPKLKSINR